MCIAINILLYYICVCCVYKFLFTRSSQARQGLSTPFTALESKLAAVQRRWKTLQQHRRCNKAREDLSRIPHALPLWDQIDAFATQPYRFLECHPHRSWGRSEPLKVNQFRAEAELRRLLTGSGFLCPTPNLPNPTWLKDSPRTGTMFICPINASKAFNTENQRHWKPQPPPVSRPERWCFWRESAARSDNTTVPMAHHRERKGIWCIQEDYPEVQVDGKEHPEFREHS